MIELLIQSYWIALLTVFVVGGLVFRFFLNKFKKENPIPTYTEYLQKQNKK